MRNITTKICLLAIFLLTESTPVFAADCRSIRSAYFKERHHCIGLFRKAYAPEKQPLSGDVVFDDDNVGKCFEGLNSTYPEFADGGECVGVEEENIDKKFKGYTKKCLHQKDFSECDRALENVKSVDNIRNGIGETLLMVATQEGDIDAMNFLLQKGASAKEVNHNAMSLLYYAVSPKTEKFDSFKDSNEVIQNVVKKVLALGVHSQELGMTKVTNLCYAIFHNLSKDIVNLLLKAGANPNLRCPIGEDRISPLHIAIAENDLDKVQLLLKAGANPNMESYVSNKGMSRNQPLLFSALDNVEIIKALVDAGANVNAVVEIGENNYSLLEVAEHNAKKNLGCNCDDEICKKKCDVAIANDEIVAFLKKAGAVKSKAFYGGSFIKYCLQPDLTEKMVYDAIKQGADVNESDSIGWTPLHVVAQEGKNPKIMMALIKKGSFVNAMTKTGVTPLLSAAKYNPNPAFIKMLINAGADIYAVNPDSKWGALEYAVAVNSPEVVSFLLKTKLGNNLEDAYKNWLVRIAVTNNPNPNVLVTLFKNGFNARPVGSGYSMKNPLYAALEKKKDAEIVKVLLKNGGVVDDKCMRLARDLPMDTPEERKYRNQMIDLLTKHKK